MATVVYSERALSDIEGALSRFGADPHSAVRAATAIRSAIDNLAAHPFIGRRVEGEMRELIVSLGATGYVALYRFLIGDDELRTLTLLPQRDLGFTP